MNTTSNRTTDKLNEAKGNVREAVNDSASKVTDLAHRAGETVRDYITTGRDEVTKVVDNYSGSVREHPVRTSLMALGAGFLLGALFRR